ncbi:MAG: preprotein translocase subunit SecE [Kordiimonadaceae bacterium]|nr:preprotein translocase subunit SecE [Kordiimonadaceae bacterium]
MARTTPADFFRQVRREASKVTWPTPKEAGITSVMVFIMVTIMAVFFLGVDFLLGAGIEWLLGAKV